jgi:uncharacterized protein YbjT (DUF2867 family)
MARRPEHLDARVGPGTEVVQGDVSDRASLARALRGVRVAYYLVHSMGSTGDYAERDRVGAENFARAAHAAGVERLVYLGGLAPDQGLSRHLASRHQVGEILRASGVPTLEFRASIIIGSGSLSFEMIRSLVEKLPVMVTPRWVRVRAQPIAIEDVIGYLVAARDIPLAGSEVFEIGGADQVSYGDIMREYARQRGLRRLMLPVPVLTPKLSSLWLGLVTPIYARVGRKILESVRSPTIVRDRRAEWVFPVRPRGVREAIRRALVNEDREFAATRWNDTFSATTGGGAPVGIAAGRRIVDSRARAVAVPPDRAFAPIRRIGGSVGWYFGDFLWSLRGFVDILAGGVGTRRGRRDPEHLAPGEALDFWRVEAFESDHLLRLAAEMKVPGRAWLQFEVTPSGGGANIRQTAIFEPLGLAGRLYWYVLYPVHAVMFRGMLRRIARSAETA